MSRAAWPLCVAVLGASWALAGQEAAPAATPAARPASKSAAEAGFLVIVHAKHPGRSIPRAVLADVFLRRSLRWGDGSDILAVDQSLRSSVRERFSRTVLELAPSAVLQYWQGQLRRGGVRPPPVMDSDAEVLDFVSAAPGRIGYVSPDASLGDAVKALSIVEQ